MIIAEDLLLLLTDDESGKSITDESSLDLALAGAVLLELAQLGRVTVAGPDEDVKEGRLRVLDGSPIGDAVLDESLRRVGDKAGKKPESVLNPLGKDLREQLLERLTAAGILRRQDGKVLGIFPTKRWPAVDRAHEAEVMTRLRSALVVGTTPDPRTAALAALLSAVDAPHKVLGAAGEELDSKAVRRRAKEIREGAWAADAVGKAIEAVQAAVMTAVTTSIVLSSASSSNC